jgi:hypothetical protein
VKRKIKELCCGNDFSGYGKEGIPKPLVLTQVLTAGQIKRDIDGRIE